jgi:Zn-dependent protease
MFGPLQPTPYDLSFSIGGIPVRVLPTFWLVAVIFGFDWLNAPDGGLAFLLIWVAVMFVSILVHELGHALVARACGYAPRILLYHFGGLAVFDPYRDYTTGKSILITLAGPGAGLLLYGLTWLADRALTGGNGDPSPFVYAALEMSLFVNLWWSLLNLLPVIPLDGGQVCRDVCLSANPRRGMTVALWISVLVGAVIGALGVAFRQMYMGIMFLLLAVQSYQELQRRRYR